MAQTLSPWQSAPEAVRSAWTAEVYPPIFPLILAITGTAFDPGWARLLTVVISAAALWTMFAWLRRELSSRLLAILCVALMALAFQWWVLHLRVLSESLFLLWLLLFLRVWDQPWSNPDRRLSCLIVLAMLLVLTRSIGLIIVPALLASAWLNRASQIDPNQKRNALLVSLGTMGAWAIWSILRPDGTAGRYADSLNDVIQALISSDPLGAIIPQATALTDAWYGVWLPYWLPGPNLPYVALSLAGGLASIGLILRLLRGKLDAWFALGYTAVLLLWPFPGQMTRFILPIIPIFTLCAFETILALVRRLQISPQYRNYVAMLPLLIWVSVATPGLGFALGRSLNESPTTDLSRIAEFHLTQDYAKASRLASSQLAMFADFERMREELPLSAVVMTFTPGYVALLANRHGAHFPDAGSQRDWLRAIHDSPADYVYVSRYHPRRTSDNGLAGLVWMEGWTREVWRTPSVLDGSIEGVMFEIDRSQIRRLLQTSIFP